MGDPTAKTGLKIFGVEVLLIIVIILVIGGFFIWFKNLIFNPKSAVKVNDSDKKTSISPTSLPKDSLTYNLINRNPDIISSVGTTSIKGKINRIEIDGDVANINIGNPPIAVSVNSSNSAIVKSSSGGQTSIPITKLKPDVEATIFVLYDFKSGTWLTSKTLDVTSVPQR